LKISAEVTEPQETLLHLASCKRKLPDEQERR
jgi:hypothetical protein